MAILFSVCLGIGIIYAIIILIGGGLSHVDMPGIDIHLDHPAVSGGDMDIGGSIKTPSVSLPAIASFVTAFGGVGLIAQGLFNASDVGSLVAAAVGGLVVATIAHFAFIYFLIKPQGSSEVTMKDIVGAVAEVVTPIPADSVGEIAFVAQGGRVTCPAKSATGQNINRNITVVIERMVGGVAFVRPQAETPRG